MLRFISFLSEKKAQGGFDYEDAVNARLKTAGLQSAEQRNAGSSADAPDGTIETNNQKHNLEIKQNKSAMMGQIELHHDGEKWVVSPNSKQKYPKTAEHIETSGFLNDINQKWSKPSGDYETDKKMGNVYKTVEGTRAIRDHYGHDRNTPYIQIGHSGLHHTTHDPANLGTPELNGNTRFRARMKYRKTDQSGKKRYGAVVVLGLKDHKPSSINLDNEEHLSKIQQG